MRQVRDTSSGRKVSKRDFVSRNRSQLLRLGVLLSVLVVVIILFFATAVEDKVYKHIKSSEDYHLENSMKEGKHILETYSSPLDLNTAYTDINTYQPENSSTLSASGATLVYKNTTIKLSPSEEGTLVKVTAKDLTQERIAFLRIIVYLLSEIADTAGDMDFDSPSMPSTPSSPDSDYHFPSTQPDYPTTGGEGTFNKNNSDDSWAIPDTPKTPSQGVDITDDAPTTGGFGQFTPNN